MKCRICGSECPPGAKLCRDCAAARKRAFAATVTMPLLAAAGVPSASGLRFAPKPKPARKPTRENASREIPPRENSAPGNPARTAAPVTVRRGQTVDRPHVVPLRPPPGSMKAIRRGSSDGRSSAEAGREKPPRRLPLIPIAGATMLVAVIAILELRSLGGHGTPTEPPEVAVAEVPRVAVSTTPSPPAGVEPQAAVAAQSQATTPSSAQTSPAAEVPTALSPPRPAARKRSSAAEPVKTPPVPAPAVVEEPPPQVAAAPARRAEAPRSDPLQSFNVALARCAHEELMARMGCEQRVRLQYCGDAWGQIAQCSIGRPTDHGQ